MAMESLSLAGLRALVTGAGTGIGKQIALGFAEAGADLVFVGRRLEPLETVAAQARDKYGVSVQCIAADITSAEDCARLGSEAGKIDILCNNAGASIYGKWQSISMEDWRQVFAVNVEGPWRLCQIFAPKMAERGFGRIINIGSVYGIQGGNPALYPGMDWDIAPYFVSKHAVHGIAHYLAPWLAKSGVTVNTLHPGGFAGSEMNEKAMSERASGLSEMEQRFQAAVPIGRIGGADDIKAAAVFMASPGSKYMTGQEVVVDGGWSAW